MTNNNETENIRTVSWEKEEAIKQNLDSEMTIQYPNHSHGKSGEISDFINVYSALQKKSPLSV